MAHLQLDRRAATGIAMIAVYGSGQNSIVVSPGANLFAQGVLRPELRATGRAALDMAIGAVGALAMTFSGRLVDAYDVTTMLLLLIPIPKLVATVLWLPMFRTYPCDQATLHKVLAERRGELTAA